MSERVEDGRLAVIVKPLEWLEVPCSDRWKRFSAKTILGNYEALEWLDGGFGMVVVPGEELTFVTFAEARPAAQAHYEQRILSALQTSPSEPLNARTQGVEVHHG